MPRKSNPVFIPTQSNAAGGTLDIDEIPQEVKDEVEEIYAGLKANPAGRMRIEFDTVGELVLYANQVQSYCSQRPTGAIRFRRSPTKNLPDTAMDFRISDLLPEKEETPASTPAPVPAEPTATKGKKAA